MTVGTRCWLINDVVSYFAPYIPYGTAGTEVMILYDHLDMMVVEDTTGNKFHSRTDNLSYTPPNNHAPAKAKEQAEQPVTKSRTPKKKVSPVIQSNLF